MFDWLAEILKYVMIFCDKISFHNYALALFLFALIVKIILFPLSIKQQKNSVKSAQLRPKELAIRKKYKGRTDKQTQQKMTMEIQEMYQKEGYSQFGGCLPLLIQLPVLLSLYSIIQNPLYYVCRFSTAQIETITEAYNRATGYLNGVVNSTYTAAINVLSYINKNGAESIINAFPKDGIVPEGAVDASGAAISDWSTYCSDIATRLNSPDLPNFNLFGFIDLGKAPNLASGLYLLVPVIVFLAMYFTMKIQKKFTYQPMASQDAANNMSMKMMDVMMPALSAFISYSLPTALAFYWVYQNVLGLAQQIILSKMYPIPKLTDEEIRQMQKEAEKEAAAAKKAQAAEKRENPKRSLHHIDDDEEYIPRRKTDDSMEDDSVFRKKNEQGKKSIAKAELKDDKKENDGEE